MASTRTKNPFVYLQQVRDEARKVVWPSRRETVISTIMVLVMAALAAVFFFAADQVFAIIIELILNIGA
ncbi:preprotein translocase subunit SecE [Notoacmeibacter marinus]|uniref:Protein translocase subunit SecE n=1 Tax=Notoacmeibacter marinus TaxID=1876515 RepID=A0A231UV68_9HYPH|nr:preprotein translocase subunit SecE [Notoacmeibacter marinus]OXS99165.1 preprotein translocase subunit SecE [Notoacmeibacter marinus]